MSYQLRCLHVGMLPLSQSTLIESRCKFVLPSESITNRPPNLFMLAKKTTTLELQYAVRVFFYYYMEMVSNTHCRHGGLTSHAVCGTLPVSCVVLQRCVLDPSVLVSCVRIQYTVSGCRGVTQKDSCMLHVPDGLLQNPQLSALNSS